MREVYRARDTLLKREVALKILPDADCRGSGRSTRAGDHPSRSETGEYQAQSRSCGETGKVEATMHAMMMWIGRGAGGLGFVLTAAAVLTRLGGSFQLANFQVTAVLQAGTAAMVLACLGYLVAIAERPS
jgi:hypothetical protein